MKEETESPFEKISGEIEFINELQKALKKLNKNKPDYTPIIKIFLKLRREIKEQKTRG